MFVFTLRRKTSQTCLLHASRSSVQHKMLQRYHTRNMLKFPEHLFFSALVLLWQFTSDTWPAYIRYQTSNKTERLRHKAKLLQEIDSSNCNKVLWKDTGYCSECTYIYICYLTHNILFLLISLRRRGHKYLKSLPTHQGECTLEIPTENINLVLPQHCADTQTYSVIFTWWRFYSNLLCVFFYNCSYNFLCGKVCRIVPI